MSSDPCPAPRLTGLKRRIKHLRRSVKRLFSSFGRLRLLRTGGTQPIPLLSRNFQRATCLPTQPRAPAHERGIRSPQRTIQNGQRPQPRPPVRPAGRRTSTITPIPSTRPALHCGPCWALRPTTTEQAGTSTVIPPHSGPSILRCEDSSPPARLRTGIGRAGIHFSTVLWPTTRSSSHAHRRRA
jgi:hypothetical protein